jgi:uracil DNA glycosylase
MEIIPNIEKSWKKHLHNELEKPYFKDIEKKLEKDYNA